MTIYDHTTLGISSELELGTGFGPEAGFISHDGEDEILTEGFLPTGMHLTTLTMSRRGDASIHSEKLYDGNVTAEEWRTQQWGALWSMSPYYQSRRILEGFDRADGTHVPGLFERVEELSPSGRVDMIVDVMGTLAELRAVDIVEQERFRDTVRNAVRELHALDPTAAEVSVGRILEILPAPVSNSIGGETVVSDPTPKLRRALDRILHPQAYVVAPSTKKANSTKSRRRPGRTRPNNAKAGRGARPANANANKRNRRTRGNNPSRGTHS